jgi:DNA-binding transcriptional regulator YhcF (GntR family)
VPLTDTGLVPSRTARVLEIIRNAILSGELAPGSALVEQELAAQLGVSKTPVREALKSLEGTGLVVMAPYRGAAVRELTRADAVAIYDLRLLLEPEAVHRSVAAGADLSGAAECLRTARAAAGNAERSMANREFHRQLYAGCGNALGCATAPRSCRRHPGPRPPPGRPRPTSTRRSSPRPGRATPTPLAASPRSTSQASCTDFPDQGKQEKKECGPATAKRPGHTPHPLLTRSNVALL